MSLKYTTLSITLLGLVPMLLGGLVYVWATLFVNLLAFLTLSGATAANTSTGPLSHEIPQYHPPTLCIRLHRASRQCCTREPIPLHWSLTSCVIPCTMIPLWVPHLKQVARQLTSLLEGGMNE